MVPSHHFKYEVTCIEMMAYASAWLLCLSLPVKKAWPPVHVLCREGGMVSVPGNPSEKGVSSVYVSPSKKDVAYMLISRRDEGIAFVSVSPIVLAVIV